MKIIFLFATKIPCGVHGGGQQGGQYSRRFGGPAGLLCRGPSAGLQQLQGQLVFLQGAVFLLGGRKAVLGVACG